MDLLILLPVAIGVGGGAFLYWLWRHGKKSKLLGNEERTQEEVPREKVPNRLEYEIERQKDNRNIIIKKGKISKRKEFLDFRFEGTRRRYYPNHIIKETIGKRTRYFVRWNAYFSEAYDKDGHIIHDDSLENALMDDMESQLGKAVGSAVGFVLERPMLYVMAVAFVVAIPIGFSYNDIFHWVPNTVIHWVQTK